MIKIPLRAGQLTAAISPIGAEITSLHHDGVGELMWPGSEDSWHRQAPLLFPIIGRYPDDLVLVGDGLLNLPPHGFAPDSTFAVAQQSEAACRLVLADDARTWAVYPYAFRLTVDFALDERGLTMAIEVHNPSTEAALPFMLGGHPGFAWPLPAAGNASDHRLGFSRREASPMLVLSGAPLSDDRSYGFDGQVAWPADIDFFSLTHALSPVSSEMVTFGTEAVNVALSFEGFETLALWRRDTSPFLCLEPWTNLPIAATEPTHFEDLPEMIRLAPGASRRFAMRIVPGGTKLGAASQS
ncbi:hypothetical protein [Devosia lacusdianchii]|uniref:aldose epimerase family protein n=1 Tax=Devosia lacusdianchii TaxID=2917991 RepID=UPI001F062C61|nr:hypothetical protein [Devosia sp. JXJ CY 41]